MQHMSKSIYLCNNYREFVLCTEAYSYLEQLEH